MEQLQNNGDTLFESAKGVQYMVDNDDVKMVSELNEDNEQVREVVDTETKLEGYANIFTKRDNIMNFVNESTQLRDGFIEQLAIVTNVAVKTEMTQSLAENVYTNFKALNKKAQDCTNAELEALFSEIEFEEGVEKKLNTEAEISYHDFLREYLILLTSAQESIELTDNAMAQIDSANKAYMHEVEQLISSLDSFEYMNSLLQQAETEKDAVKKNKLMDEWKSYYAASDLGIITDILNNKPMKILLKEMKKEYKAYEKKAFNILKNDKVTSFMDIRALEICLHKIYGKEHVQAANMILFLLYKKINKRNRVDDVRLSFFLNLFTLNVYKIARYKEKEKEDSVFYKQLKETLEKIEELIDVA